MKRTIMIVAAFLLLSILVAPALSQWLQIDCTQNLIDRGICPVLGENGLLMTYWISAEPVTCDAAAVAANRCRATQQGQALLSEAERVARTFSIGSGWAPGILCDTDLVSVGVCETSNIGQTIPALRWAEEMFGRNCIDSRVRNFEADIEQDQIPDRGSPRRKAKRESRVPRGPGPPGPPRGGQ